MKKIKKITGPDAIDTAAWLAGGVASIKFIANKVPYLGPTLWTIDGLRLANSYMQKLDLENFAAAKDRGKGILVVEYAYEGAPSGNGSWMSYYTWDGVGNPFL